jgi:hypothetical protein
MFDDLISKEPKSNQATSMKLIIKIINELLCSQSIVPASLFPSSKSPFPQ